MSPNDLIAVTLIDPTCLPDSARLRSRNVSVRFRHDCRKIGPHCRAIRLWVAACSVHRDSSKTWLNSSQPKSLHPYAKSHIPQGPKPSPQLHNREHNPQKPHSMIAETRPRTTKGAAEVKHYMTGSTSHTHPQRQQFAEESDACNPLRNLAAEIRKCFGDDRLPGKASQAQRQNKTSRAINKALAKVQVTTSRARTAIL